MPPDEMTFPLAGRIGSPPLQSLFAGSPDAACQLIVEIDSTNLRVSVGLSLRLTAAYLPAKGLEKSLQIVPTGR
jgi:hypothetical protein